MLDLFSGVGGMALALRRVATPIGYCESADAPRDVLRALAARGALPRAPIHGDIREFVDVPRADVVAAGFPCVGFSGSGERRGFGDAQSRLFFDMLRVVDRARPRLLFLENVPGLLRLGMDDVVRELSRRRGYSLRWCVLAASDVGAPHLRRRWYCVAYRRGSDLPGPDEFAGIDFDWSRGAEPPRMTTDARESDRRRLRLLGNAMVPDAARAAFMGLCGAAVGDEARRGRWPSRGCVLAYTSVALELAPLAPRRRPSSHPGITLDPKAYVSTRRRSPILTCKEHRKPVIKQMWATPTASALGPANYLTTRSDHALPSQVRFERGTPDRLRGGRLSARWVEWLMGFPPGWTDGVGHAP